MTLTDSSVFHVVLIKVHVAEDPPPLVQQVCFPTFHSKDELPVLVRQPQGTMVSDPPESQAMSYSTIYDTPFDRLPNPRQVWVGRPGDFEEGLGRLALLTEDVVAQAASAEIKTGRRTSLGWSLNKLEVANIGRQSCQHQIIPLLGGIAFDDVYTMNPRIFSQICRKFIS